MATENLTPVCEHPQSVTAYCATLDGVCYRYETTFIDPEGVNA